MGLLLRLLSLLLALWALAHGAWLLAVPLLLYASHPWGLRALLLLGALLKGLAGLGARAWRPLLLALAVFSLYRGAIKGGLLLLLALLLLHLLFGSAGRGFTLRGDERCSLLLRRFGIRWALVAEVRPASPRLAALLGQEAMPLMLVAQRTGRLLLVLEGTHITRRGAEASLLRRLGRLALALAPRRVYLLPLPTSRLREALLPGLRRLRLVRGQEMDSLAQALYDVAVLRLKRGRIGALGLYRQEANDEEVRLPRPFAKLRAQPPAARALEVLLSRLPPRGPDHLTSLLARLAAGAAEQEELRGLDLAPELLGALLAVYGRPKKARRAIETADQGMAGGLP